MNIWFEEDVCRLLSAIVAARMPLTDDEKDIIIAMACGFGLDARFDGDKLSWGSKHLTTR